jgi:acyl-CoA synthetase (NDP forming)
MLEDPATQGIICYAEQVKRPADLLAVAELSRSKGKPILMMIPGRSEQARAATATHTGAMSGDYAVMRMMVEESGIVVLDTLEDLLDVGQIMRQHPHHTGGGLGVVTSSGGICGLTQDYCATLGLEVPPLSQAQADKLKPHLQSFVTPRNPLDLGTLPAWQPKLMEEGILAMLGDPAVGSVMVANAYVGPPISTAWASFTTTVPQEKPLIYVVFNEDVPLPEEADKIMREHGTVVMRSPERAMRALAALTAYTRRRMAWEKPLPAVPFADLPGLGSHGPQPEWLSKQLLAKMGIATPEGGLATTADEAVAIANRVGYPVALKAQAATLTHKSDAGGVLLGIGDDAGLRRQWQVLYDNIARAEPGLKLDGALVEKMGARGVELVVGARRDPQWGPVLLVGLGGVWIEALGDVKLLPAGVSETRIIAALRQLKGAKLLQGFRGAPPVDMQAVARVAAAVGRLMLTRPDIAEIDVNPLIAYGEGEGAVALDALIVTQ